MTTATVLLFLKKGLTWIKSNLTAILAIVLVLLVYFQMKDQVARLNKLVDINHKAHASEVSTLKKSFASQQKARDNIVTTFETKMRKLNEAHKQQILDLKDAQQRLYQEVLENPDAASALLEKLGFKEYKEE